MNKSYYVTVPRVEGTNVELPYLEATVVPVPIKVLPGPTDPCDAGSEGR
jgi:hypothetical protein